MKKCFLLISIILVAFGFSLNSNVISDSFKNNSIDNTKQIDTESTQTNTNLLTDPQPSHEIVIDQWEGAGSEATSYNAKTNSDSLVFHYSMVTEVEMDSLTISAYWSQSPEEDKKIINTKEKEEMEKDEITNDGSDYYTYDGYLTIKELPPNSRFNPITITGKDVEGDNEYKTSSSSINYSAITKLGVNGEGKVTKNSLIVEEDKATANYTISANSATEDNNNDYIQPSKILWVNEEKPSGGNQKSSYEIIEEQDLSNEELTAEGELNKDICTTIDLNKTYKTTRLVVLDERNNYYYTGPFSISNDSQEKTTTINEDEDNPLQYEKTTAQIGYTIDIGEGSQGEELEIGKVSWKQNGGSLVGNATNSNGNESGILYAEGLTSGGIYNTYLEVEMTDKNGKYYDTYKSIDNGGGYISFTTISDIERGTITVDEDDITTTKDSATVPYVLTPKINDSNTGNIEPVKMIWVEEDYTEDTDEPLKCITGEEIDYPDGNITLNDLSGNTPHTDERLIVTDAKGNEYQTEPFSYMTNPLDEKGKVTTTNLNVGATWASTEYTITPAKNNDGEIIYPTRIEWIVYSKDSNEGNDIIKTDYLDETDVIDGKIVKTIETGSELSPNTNYHTKLKVYDGSAKPYYTKGYIDFTTGVANQDGIVTGTVDNKKGSSATMNYTITPKTNDDGTALELTRIIWYDEKDHVLKEERLDVTPSNAKDIINGQMTTSILEPNENYITHLDVGYIAGDGEEYFFSSTDNKGETIDFQAGNFKTKKIIIGSIILGIFAVIFAFIGFFFWAYKKRRRVS